MNTLCGSTDACSIWISSPHGQQPPTSWLYKAGSDVDANTIPKLIIVLRGHLVFSFFSICFVFVLTILTNFLSAAVDSWRFQLDCGRGAIVSHTLFFDKQDFERWIYFRETTSDFPASFTPITCFFWSRRSSLDFPVVLFVHQSLKVQQLLTIRITLKM